MSNVIVKENETLDSALRRFKRNCAKAGIQQEIRKESITRNQVLNVRKNRKLQENVSTTNKIESCHICGSFLTLQEIAFL